MNNRHTKTLLSALLLFSILCCVFFTGCDEQTQESDIIPDASADFYVYDEAQVLSEQAEEYILAQNDALFALTGAQIVVACVNTTGYTDIADYAKDMFNQWGIGSAEKNNGVLLLLSIWEDDYWLLQGQGLEDLLPSGTVKLMLNEHLEPYFAEQQYESGVLVLFDALCAHLESVYAADLSQWNGESGAFTQNEAVFPSSDEEYSDELDTAMIAIIIVIVILIIAAANSSSGGSSSGGSGRSGKTVIIPTVSYRPRYHRPTGGSHYGGRIGGFGGSSGGFGGRTGGGGRSRGGGAGRR